MSNLNRPCPYYLIFQDSVTQGVISPSQRLLQLQCDGVKLRRLSRASPYRVTSPRPASVGRASGEPRFAHLMAPLIRPET